MPVICSLYENCAKESKNVKFWMY